MADLSLQEIHQYCLGATQIIINGFRWRISVGTLSAQEKSRLSKGIETSLLNWAWGMNQYRGTAEDDGILDISLKLTGRRDPELLQAVILCKFDLRRNEFGIGMIENFIRDEITPLTGNTLTIALIYATTFCSMVGLDEVHIFDPVEAAQARYKEYGFAFAMNSYNKMSAELPDILETLRMKAGSYARFDS